MYVGCGRVCVTYYSMMALERLKDTPQQNIQNRLVLYRAGVHDVNKRVNFLEPLKVLTHVHKMLHGERESLCKPKRGGEVFSYHGHPVAWVVYLGTLHVFLFLST